MKDRAKVRVFLSDRATIQIYVISLILSSLFTSSTANAVSEAKANNGWKNPIDVTVKYDATVKYKLIGLDLDTGKILEDERVIKNFNELRNIPQMEEVDLLFFERFGLLCQYLHWIPLCNSDWHTKTADSLLNSRAWQMALEDELPSSPLRTSSGLRTMYLDITLPVTFLFETGHGSVGMAQVLGQGDEPNTMRIHYKMTQQKPPVRKRVSVLSGLESMGKMSDFSTACLKYALEHNNTLPLSIEQPDIEFSEKHWAKENLVYLGNGQNLLKIKDFSQVPIVYDRVMLDEYGLTNLMLANCQSSVVSRDRLESILKNRQTIPLLRHIPPKDLIYTAQNNRAELLSGVTVELIQITRIPVSGQPLWAPDGRVMEKALIDRTDFQPEKNPLKELLNYFVFVARISGPAVDTKSNRIPWESDFSLGHYTTSGFLNDERIYRHHFCTSAAAFPKNVTSTMVRMAVAAGPWETIGIGHELGTYETDDYVVIMGPPYPPFGGPQEPGCLKLGVTADVNQKDFRIVAVDKNGKEHVSYERRLNWYFEELDYNDIKEFRFQTRPYIWVEFPNVSLCPASTQA